MPTFRSIGVHPDLHKRLVVTAAPVTNKTGGDAELQQQQPSSLLVPIATPYALLSRPPGSLRLATNDRLESSKPLAIAQVETLRHDVAVAMLQTSKTGRYWNRIAQACREARRTSSAALGLMDDDYHDDDDDQGSYKNDNADAIFPSAFDLLQYQQTQLIPKRIELSTGCRSLDRAIALPPEFSAYASPTPLAPKVQQQANITNDGINDGNNDDQTSGIPFGFITQLTGPPGSGKSQLAQHLALACARLGGTVWYLHSSAPPFLSAATSAAAVGTTTVTTTPQVLQRIVVASAWDGYDLLRRLAELESSLEQHTPTTTPTTAAKSTTTAAKSTTMAGENLDDPPAATVLIVDSCSVCLAAPDDETLYGTVSSTIKRLTREYDLATILTIGTVVDRRQLSTSSSSSLGQGGVGHFKAALGQYWSGVADIEVWLEPALAAPSGTIKATVLRHFAKEASTCMHHFAVQESGIVDVGSSR